MQQEIAHLFYIMDSKKTKTVRLVYPQWQGGVNPNYAIGSEILNLVLPKGKNTETLEFL